MVEGGDVQEHRWFFSDRTNKVVLKIGSDASLDCRNKRQSVTETTTFSVTSHPFDRNGDTVDGYDVRFSLYAVVGATQESQGLGGVENFLYSMDSETRQWTKYVEHEHVHCSREQVEVDISINALLFFYRVDINKQETVSRDGRTDKTNKAVGSIERTNSGAARGGCDPTGGGGGGGASNARLGGGGMLAALVATAQGGGRPSREQPLSGDGGGGGGGVGGDSPNGDAGDERVHDPSYTSFTGHPSVTTAQENPMLFLKNSYIVSDIDQVTVMDKDPIRVVDSLGEQASFCDEQSHIKDRDGHWVTAQP